MKTLYRPELLYSGGRFIAGGELLVGEDGCVVGAIEGADISAAKVVELPGKALCAGICECTFAFVSAIDSR